MSTTTTTTNVPADEQVLWAEYHRTRSVAARNAIAERYQPMLIRTAVDVIKKHQLPRHVEAYDLAAEGFFGLVQAIERFDPSRGLRFGTYAQTRVRGAMIDSIRDADWMPRHIRYRTTLRERTADRLTVQHGRPPTHDEVRDAVHPDRKQADAIMRTEAHGLQTFNALTYRVSRGTNGPAEAVADPHDPLATVDAWDEIELLMSKLTLRERFVLCLYFGGATQWEIGERIGRSEALVSSVRRRVIERLRAEASAA